MKWCGEAAGRQPAPSAGQKSDGLLKKLNTQFDRGAKDMLKQSELADRPTFEELKGACDSGPEALAKLLVNGLLPNWAVLLMAQTKLEEFISALLTHGMDPDTKNQWFKLAQCRRTTRHSGNLSDTQVGLGQ